MLTTFVVVVVVSVVVVVVVPLLLLLVGLLVMFCLVDIKKRSFSLNLLCALIGLLVINDTRPFRVI